MCILKKLVREPDMDSHEFIHPFISHVLHAYYVLDYVLDLKELINTETMIISGIAHLFPTHDIIQDRKVQI